MRCASTYYIVDSFHYVHFHACCCNYIFDNTWGLQKKIMLCDMDEFRGKNVAMMK